MALLRTAGIPCRFHAATIHKRLQERIVTGLFYWLAAEEIHPVSAPAAVSVGNIVFICRNHSESASFAGDSPRLIKNHGLRDPQRRWRSVQATCAAVAAAAHVWQRIIRIGGSTATCRPRGTIRVR